MHADSYRNVARQVALYRVPNSESRMVPVGRI